MAAQMKGDYNFSKIKSLIERTWEQVYCHHHLDGNTLVDSSGFHYQTCTKCQYIYYLDRDEDFE